MARHFARMLRSSIYFDTEATPGGFATVSSSAPNPTNVSKVRGPRVVRKQRRRKTAIVQTKRMPSTSMGIQTSRKEADLRNAT